MTIRATATGALPSGRVRIPDHVVRRDFAAETVVLNLRTGQYHGLNPTAGRMLAALEATGTIATAAERVASEHGEEIGRVHSDLVELCGHLLERDLIEVTGRGGD